MKNNHKFDLAFLDMLFNMTLAFAFLFLMAFMLIRPPTETQKSIQMKAEFMLTLTWPDGSLDDQDLWLLLPNGKKLGYSRKDLGYATLDRDDRGSFGNFFPDEKGVLQLIPSRREIITIRAIMPGRYVVNVHTYSKSDAYGEFENKTPMPYNTTVTLSKINPIVTDIIKKNVLVERVAEQVTAFAFTVDADGQVVSVETDVDEPFIEMMKEPSPYRAQP
jgi:hypothetical protein